MLSWRWIAVALAALWPASSWGQYLNQPPAASVYQEDPLPGEVFPVLHEPARITVAPPVCEPPSEGPLVECHREHFQDDSSRRWDHPYAPPPFDFTRTYYWSRWRPTGGSFRDCLPPIHGHVTGGTFLHGLRGHLQSPRGGELGTTSSHRPTVEEIGLDGAEFAPTFDTRLRFADDHEVHFNSIWIDRSGSATLADPLISDGVAFPRGAAVSSELGYDTFRLGYRPQYWWADLWGVIFKPEFGFGVTFFEYRLSSPAVAGAAEKDYDFGFYYLGFLAERQLTERLRLELDFAGSGGANGVSLIDAELRGLYEFWCRGRCRSSLVVGWRGLYLRRHDNQDHEQNDPN
ncbi:MAG: hypothetical protein ACREIV_15475, partial [Planctomycetaceae bacterium]